MAKVIKLHKSKSKPAYKYGIEQQVTSLPRTVTINDLVKHLEADGITRNEFYGDRKIPFGSEKSISADRLLIYCKVFDCSIDDLINHEVKATSLRQSIGKKFKTGLR